MRVNSVEGKSNPYHVPTGSPEEGQFTSGEKGVADAATDLLNSAAREEKVLDAP